LLQVWAIKPEEIRCIQVHDVKEAVYELAANDKVACFVSQGPGVKASYTNYLTATGANLQSLAVNRIR
jgi:hypothetical protein